MAFILIGCLAFSFLYLFDFNKIRLNCKSINVCFAISVVLLAYSTIGILLGHYKRTIVNLPLQIIAGFFAVIALILLLYSLFFALPFNATYVDAEDNNTVVDTGMYALCRHPGVIWFFFLYLFLWLSSGIKIMMWAGLVWTLMDVFHVYLQDNWFFPLSLKDYELYKTGTPFLIPSLGSIKKSITTF